MDNMDNKAKRKKRGRGQQQNQNQHQHQHQHHQQQHQQFILPDVPEDPQREVRRERDKQFNNSKKRSRGGGGGGNNLNDIRVQENAVVRKYKNQR